MTSQVAGGQANLGWKYLFFQLLLTIKVNLVAKILQSTYLCVIFHVNHKTLPFLAVLSWFLILGKIQDGGQDGDHCWWRHRPPAAPLPIKYTSPCWEEQRLSTKGKLVSKYCNISKTPGRGSIHPLPSPPRLYHGRGMNLRVRPRVNNHESRTNKNLTWITWENQYSSSHWE